MKGTDNFKIAIKTFLEKRAEGKQLLKMMLLNPKKNIDDCVTYILNQVKASGSNGFEDDEIYKMAVHYYDEDDITIGGKIENMNVVVNHHVELTAEEIEKLKQDARDAVIKEERDKMLNKKKAPTLTPQSPEGPPTLF